MIKIVINTAYTLTLKKNNLNLYMYKPKNLYSNVLKTKKVPKKVSKKVPKKVSKKVSKKGSKKKLNKLPPKIFFIQAHSSACTIKDMDSLMESGTLIPIKYLESAYKKYPKYRKQFLEDIEKLRDYDIDNLICHNAVNHKSEKFAEFFCNNCLEETKGKHYLWCKECNDSIHKTKSRKLHNPSLFTTRINLKNDFPKGDKIKVLMGQSSGRAGLVSTIFKMIEEYPSKYSKILNELVDTDINNPTDVSTIIKKLNEITNVSNKKFERVKVLHKNKVDTDFRYYPRINKEKTKSKGKTINKERYIAGPIDFKLNFSPGEHKVLRNGIHWPLGVYNIEDFDNDSLVFDLLVKNKDKVDKFFTVIDTTDKDSTELKTFKKALLLYVDNLSNEQKENSNIYEDSMVIKDYLNIPQDENNANPTPNTNSNYNINRYNKYLFDNLFYKNKKLKTRASISSIISNIIKYEGEHDREMLFIVNQCRTSFLTRDDFNLAESYNEIMEPRTATFHGLRRENSNF